jgi:hypothetical protein
MGSTCIHLLCQANNKGKTGERRKCSYIIVLKIGVHVIAGIVQVPHSGAENLDA